VTVGAVFDTLIPDWVIGLDFAITALFLSLASRRQTMPEVHFLLAVVLVSAPYHLGHCEHCRSPR
jgi:predicted branched-subunit amino acid permease